MLLCFVEVARDLLWLSCDIADKFEVSSGQLRSSVKRREFSVDPRLIIELWVPAKRFQRQIVQLVLRTGGSDLTDNLQAFGLVGDRSVTGLLDQLAH